jgi:tetratricopeptide (TPR) repeat protein
MGIFDFFKNINNSQNKKEFDNILQLFHMCSVMMTNVDGEESKDEIDLWQDSFKAKYIELYGSESGFENKTTEIYHRISKLIRNNTIIDEFKKGAHFDKKQKNQLINLMFDIMISDQKVHMKEIDLLYTVGHYISFDTDEISSMIVNKIGFHPNTKDDKESFVDLNDEKIIALGKSQRSFKYRLELFEEIENLIEAKNYSDCKDKCTELIGLLEEVSKKLDNAIIQQATLDFSISYNVLDIYHKRGACLFSLGDESSIKDFSYVIKIHEDYEDAYYMRGSAYFILLEDWQKAIPDIKKYLTFSPDDKAGNQMLIVLEEIKKNSPKVSKLYKKGVSEYLEAEKLLHNSENDKEAIVHLNKSKENLEKALDLYSQKNRVYMYQKSHSFSLCDIYFKILQCNLQLGGIDASDGKFSHDDAKNPMTECIHIYKISKGKYRPDKSDLGAKLYYMIVDKAKDN